MLPPRWFRRAVMAPVVPLLTVALLVTLPLTLIGAAVASTWLPGRWRGLRVLYFALVYLVVDSLTLLWLFVLWLGSGLGRHVHEERWQARHYALMRVYLGLMVSTARRTFAVELVTETAESEDGGQARAAEGTPTADASTPILVFSRHAGPGDSFLLVHELLQRGYRPRVVLKGALQWAPVVDVALNRVPSFFVAPGSARGLGAAAVRELAAGLGPWGALVIFPEGANYTPHRRLRSIAKLEEQGRHDEAEAAREMRHVLAPRSGGALAALAGAPDADVRFVAHTGLEDLSSLADLWRGIPMESSVQVRTWRVPRPEVPRTPAAADAWLQWWWRRIDAWLVAVHGESAAPDAVVETVRRRDPG
jgi:1-acyl-sn-glycerol-3-phosphate acyltransferase